MICVTDSEETTISTNQDLQEQIDQFFLDYPKRIYKNNDVLVENGDDPPGVMYLVEGEVAQFDVADNGSKIVVNTFKPPAFFPMSWAINHTKNQYFFQAVGNVEVRVCPPQDAVDFIKNTPEVLYDLLSRVYRGTDGLLRRSAHLMGGSAQTKLLYGLVVRSRRFGEVCEDDSIIIRISETSLASEVGLSRETVNRELQKLKELDLVSVDSRKIRIISLGKLEDFLDSRI